jgi:hypothetical protein
MHDGGTSVQFRLNNQTVCDSQADYLQAPLQAASMGKESGHDHADSTLKGMSECSTPVQLKKGDLLSVTANFDAEKHPM